MNPHLQKFADAEANRTAGAIKELFAACDTDQELLQMVQKIGINVTTAVQSEIVDLKGKQRVTSGAKRVLEEIKAEKKAEVKT